MWASRHVCTNQQFDWERDNENVTEILVMLKIMMKKIHNTDDDESSKRSLSAATVYTQIKRLHDIMLQGICEKTEL